MYFSHSLPVSGAIKLTNFVVGGVGIDVGRGCVVCPGGIDAPASSPTTNVLSSDGPLFLFTHAFFVV